MSEKELRDSIIRLAIYLEAVKNYMASYNARLMRRYLRDLREALNDFNYEDLGAITIREFKQLLKSVKSIHDAFFVIYKDDLTELLEGFRDDVNNIVYSIANEYDNTSKYEEDEDNVWFIIIPGLALSLGDVYNNAKSNLFDKIQKAIRISYAQHESGLQLKERLIGDARTLRGGEIARGINSLNAFTSTAIKRIEQDRLVNQFRQISEKYEWVSVLDSRTSEICMGLDNRVFEYGKGPVPPAHYRCRSTIKPYTGEKVPSFEDWIQTQPKGFIRDAFRYLNRSKNGVKEFSSKTIGSLGISELLSKRSIILN
jgi:SPP1 gp7 family putative phage head morphogenesis protein